ncbi:cell cycle control protein [Aspergillus luchuensis]|uniref:Cell cycle control protein n=1 Tax=Aspergillus kawachii TaxID=1069201 RepID=A0A146FGP6_ASPKA|nr:cell cycle control protein [Aspergillus luchuensis]
MSWSLADMLYNDFGSEKEASDGDEEERELDARQRQKAMTTLAGAAPIDLGSSGFVSTELAISAPIQLMIYSARDANICDSGI